MWRVGVFNSPTIFLTLHCSRYEIHDTSNSVTRMNDPSQLRVRAAECQTVTDCILFADQLTADRVDSGLRQAVYRGGRELADPIGLLRWTERIMESFSGPQWAHSEYGRAPEKLSDDAVRAAYKVSHSQWLERAV